MGLLQCILQSRRFVLQSVEFGRAFVPGATRTTTVNEVKPEREACAMQEQSHATVQKVEHARLLQLDSNLTPKSKVASAVKTACRFTDTSHYSHQCESHSTKQAMDDERPPAEQSAGYGVRLRFYEACFEKVSGVSIPPSRFFVKLYLICSRHVLF